MRRGKLAIALAAGVVIAGGLTIAVLRDQPSTKPDVGWAEVHSRAVAGQTRAPLQPAPMVPRVATPPPAPPNLDTGCRIGQGPPQLSPVPAATTDRVDAAWARIERWLTAHAPATVLGPPAAPARIAQAQRGTGAAFPAELIASLQRHEGTEAANGFTFPPFYALSSLDGLVRDAKTMCSVLTEPQLAWGAGTWWSGQWLPFAADHAGDSLFLAPNGKLGEHDNEASANFDRLPPDLPNLLEQTATALETGQPIIAGYRPKVQNGVLAWEIPR